MFTVSTPRIWLFLKRTVKIWLLSKKTLKSGCFGKGLKLMGHKNPNALWSAEYSTQYCTASVLVLQYSVLQYKPRTKRRRARQQRRDRDGKRLPGPRRQISPRLLSPVREYFQALRDPRASYLNFASHPGQKHFKPGRPEAPCLDRYRFGHAFFRYTDDV